VGPTALSATAAKYTHAAISDNTRRTYSVPVQQYRAWCAKNDVSDPSALTPIRASNWLASLAEGGTLKSSTIRTYRSAVSTWWREQTLSEAANPMESIAVQRLMTGIEKSLRPSEVAARAAQTPTVAITTPLLGELEGVARGSDPSSIMRWAAAMTATYAGLRPSELLGSAQHRDRALRPEAITFFLSKGSEQRAGWLPPGADADLYAIPDRFEIRLGPTKTDPFGAREAKVVAGAPAVRALYRWTNIRRHLTAHIGGTELFRAPGEHPLSIPQLGEYLSQWHQAVGRGPLLVKGKAFRQGGASSALASGAEPDEIASLIGWASGAAMVQTYANRAAKKERARLVSRGMVPPPRS
jgi:site-specific recombinase XerD